jgi:hypothetical protein
MQPLSPQTLKIDQGGHLPRSAAPSAALASQSHAFYYLPATLMRMAFHLPGRAKCSIAVD